MSYAQPYVSQTQTLHIFLADDHDVSDGWLDGRGRAPSDLLGEVTLGAQTIRLYIGVPGRLPACQTTRSYTLTSEQVAAVSALVRAFCGEPALYPPLTPPHHFAPPRPRGAETAAPPDALELSPREREVLALVARGLRNHQIAAALSISVGTVKKHVSSVLSKLRATSRTEAVAYAVRANLIADN